MRLNGMSRMGFFWKCRYRPMVHVWEAGWFPGEFTVAQDVAGGCSDLGF